MDAREPSLPPAYLAAQMGWVRELARSLVRDPSEADDVSQEVWLAAARRPPRSGANPRAWLAVVTRHIAAARGRAELRRRRRELLASPGDAHARDEDVLARGEACQRIVAAVMALDEPYRSTVLRRYLDGLSVAEIAARDGTSPAAVRKRLSRAMQELRGALDAEFGGDRRAWVAVLGGLVAMKKFLLTAAVLVLLVGALRFAPSVREWFADTNARSAPDPSADALAGAATPDPEPGTSPAAGDARASLASAAKPGMLRFTGSVLDLPYPDSSLAPKPAAGVEVIVSFPILDAPVPTGTTKSGPDGGFQIELEDPGQRPLYAMLTAEGDGDYRPKSASLQLEAGATGADQRLGRAAHGDLHGIVVDDQERPLAGVAVQLANAGGMSFLEPDQLDAQVTTDGAGAFTFRALRMAKSFYAGSPTLVPIRSGFRALPSAPSSPLPTGGWRDVRLRMVATGGTLIVRVHDEQGRPEVDALVGVTMSKGEPGAHWEPWDFRPGAAPFHGVTDAAGRVALRDVWIGKRLELHVATEHGSWVVDRTSAGRAAVREPASGSAIVANPTTALELEVVLPGRLRLRGRVVDAAGAGVPNANVRLRPRNGNREGLSYPATIHADASGAFEHELLRPAHAFPLEVSAYSGPDSMGPLETLLPLEGRLVARELVEVTPESPDEILLQVLAQPALTIAGTVREADGSACKGQIAAIPSGACEGDHTRGCGVGIGADGRFEIGGLLPGSYDLDVRPLRSFVFTDCLLTQRFPGIAAGSSDVALVLGGSPAVKVEIEVHATEGTPASFVLVTGFHYPYVARDPTGHSADPKQDFAGCSGWPKGAILNFGGQSGDTDAEGSTGFLHQAAKVPLHELPPMNPGWYCFGIDASEASGQRYHPCGTGLVYLAPGTYRFRFDLLRQTRVVGRILGAGERDDLCVGLVTPAGRPVQVARTNMHQDEVVAIGAGGRFELEGAPVGEYRLRVGSQAQLRAGEFVAEVPLSITGGDNQPVEIRVP